MKEFFIVSNSCAAPFFSDTGMSFVFGDTPEQALGLFVKNYKHPFGLYAAAIYNNSDAYHKGLAPIVRWCKEEKRV